MCLYWSDGQDAEYIRGHVTADEAQAVLATEGITCKNAVITHRWGRWGFANGWLRHEGLDRELILRDAPERGAFKLTEIRDVTTEL